MIFVPLNVCLVAPELVTILANCSPRLLVHDEAFVGLAAKAGPVAVSVAALSAAVSGFEQAAASGRHPGPYAETTLEEVSTILYTFGTTGLPKGVIATHGMNLFNAVNLDGLAELSDRSVLLCVLPLLHTGGLDVYANPVFHVGGTAVIMPASAACRLRSR